MAGRTSKYSEAVASAICERIAMGESLVKICQDKKMPGYQTVRGWIARRGEFSDRYARAKEDGAEYEAQRILDIADDPDIDPQHKRIMVDARKWIASKLKPKIYGDKVDLNHSGDVSVQVFEIAGAKVTFGSHSDSTLPGDA